MAATTSTMASQLIKSSFTSSALSRGGLVSPNGISGAPLRVLPLPSRRKNSLTVKAVQADKPVDSRDIESLDCLVPIQPAGLSDSCQPTPPRGRGRFGPWIPLGGPICKDRAGPLRNTELSGAAGSLAAGGLLTILSICLTIYGISSFKEGEPSTAPSLTLTGRKKQPDQLQTADGWAKFTGGFFFWGNLWCHLGLFPSLCP